MTKSQTEIKSHLLAALVSDLEDELTRAMAASALARSGSTHEEASAKSKYETQSTELSYLANGQALRARDLIENIAALKNFTWLSTSEPTITLGSIVEIGDETLEETESKRFFIVPVASGRKLIHEGCTYMTLTPTTPKGKELVGLVEGDYLANESQFIKKVG